MHPRLAVLTVASLAAAAHADVVEMAFSMLGSGSNTRLTAGDRSFGAFAGQLIHDVRSGAGEAAALTGWQMFYCTDVLQPVSRSQSEFAMTAPTQVPDSNPMSAATAAAVGSLIAYTGLEPFSSGVSNTYAAAFQLSLWEIVSDFDPQSGRASLDLASGWFTATPSGPASLRNDILSQADLFLDAAARGDEFAGSLIAFRSDRYQDQMYATIPTAGSSVTLAAGLMLAFTRRRR